MRLCDKRKGEGEGKGEGEALQELQLAQSKI
jgi:hypothetical protein